MAMYQMRWLSGPPPQKRSLPGAADGEIHEHGCYSLGLRSLPLPVRRAVANCCFGLVRLF